MKIYQSESTVSPPYIDVDSSRTLTYVNTNIHAIDRVDDITGDVQELYTYSVSEYTKSEWAEQQIKSLSEISNQQDEILLNQYEAQVTQDSAIIDLYEQIGGIASVH